MTRSQVGAVLVVVGMALAACGGGGGPDAVAGTSVPAGGGTPSGEGTGGQMSMDVDLEQPIEASDEFTVMGNEGDTTADQVMIAAADATNEFWARTFPEVYGEEFEPLGSGFWSYGPDTPPADLPPCQGITQYDEQIAVNAFYCPGDDLIAWDRDGLIDPFIAEFGQFGAAIIMAHEMGHAVQARTGDFTRLQDVIAELQADCFAGAWVADVVDGGSDLFVADVGQLDLAIAGQIAIGDEPGFEASTAGAHGAGFDRVAALSQGLDEGAARCADYAEDQPVITEDSFDPGEESTMGNLDPDALIEVLVPDLEDFYADLFASEDEEWEPVDDLVFFDPASDEVSCGNDMLTEAQAELAIFYCEDDNTVYGDGTGLVSTLDEIGDFALGGVVARQWAFAAQAQEGVEPGTLESSLNADCLNGLYVGDLFFELRDTGLRLSAGDVDEVVTSFLSFNDAGADAGAVFERSEAFRTGFIGNLDDCDALL